MPNAKHWPCSIDEYHADGANSVSHSELDVFLRSPALYHGRYIAKLPSFQKKASASLDLGQILHDQILDDGDMVVTIPQSVLSANGAKAGGAWKTFEAMNPGKLFLKEHEFEPVRQMIKSIARHPKAVRLLNEGDAENEYPVRWECAETGLTRRARLDRWLFNHPLAIDLKSCRYASPERFAKSCVEFGYHRQAAYYQDAVEALTGDRPPFVFIAVESAAPFDCEVYELDEAFIDLGREQNSKALRDLLRARENNEWTSPTHGTIVKLSAPSWAGNYSQWELEDDVDE